MMSKNELGLGWKVLLVWGFTLLCAAHLVGHHEGIFRSRFPRFVWVLGVMSGVLMAATLTMQWYKARSAKRVD